MMNADVRGWFEERSRELWICCNSSGTIAAIDPRAARLLGTMTGVPLQTLALPGTEDKVAELVRRGMTEELRGWELVLLVEGRPATVVMHAFPRDEQVALIGSLIAEDFANAVRGVTEAMDDVVELNREIARQKREISSREQTLLQVNRELTESHRGILALHAELEDRADQLRLGAEIKTRVVANVSHEFRTPLHSILGLSGLLLGGSDGPLNAEQETQVRFIRSAAEELSQLVNDLLDLSKLESGKSTLRLEPVALPDLMSALRGTLRPLLPEDRPVELLIDEPQPLEIETDSGKLSQILRNLVANALKFTEAGHVRVLVRRDESTDEVVFDVEDSGIGIALADQDRIFEEFAQVESDVQMRVKGTGLGLALSRRLADMLGGSLRVSSELGKGSTFTLRVPRLHPEAQEMQKLESRSRVLDPTRAPVLVVEDDRKTIFLYERYLAMSGFQVIPARNIEDAREKLKTVRPAAVILDIMLENETTWRFLADLKSNPETQYIPVLVVTVTDREQKARALGADEFWLKPVNQEQLIGKLKLLSTPTAAASVLCIDDDPAARYLVRKYLYDSPYRLLEAGDGHRGVELAREEMPQVILLDFLLDRMTAFDVLDELKADPRTRSIPVIVVTSHILPLEDRQKLALQTEAIISKEHLSRELAINRIRDALRKAGLGSHSASERT